MTDGSNPVVARSPEAGAAIDLLGLLAYAELASFLRLSGYAEFAPTVGAKRELADFAATEYGRFTRLLERLRELGADVDTAMTPFIAPIDAWHAQTMPQSWLESLVKIYVGDGIVADFYRQVAELVDPDTRDFVRGVLAETGHVDFITGTVHAAVAQDQALAGRLALWARRLVGEALSQAQGVATERPELAALFSGHEREDAAETGDVTGISRIFARLTDAHTGRIQTLGLST